MQRQPPRPNEQPFPIKIPTRSCPCFDNSGNKRNVSSKLETSNALRSKTLEHPILTRQLLQIM